MQNKFKLAKLRTFKNFHKGVFSPNGELLALSGSTYTDVINAISQNRLSLIAVNNSVILGAKFSPDGRLLAMAYKLNENSNRAEFKVILWEVLSGKEKLNLPVVEDEWYRNIDDLSFSNDGLMLASNLGGIARLWNAVDGTETRRFLPPVGNGDLHSERVLLSPNGKRLAVYFASNEPLTGVICVWDLSSEKQIELRTNVYLDWAFSTDSGSLVFTTVKNRGGSDEHSLAEIWNIDNGQQTTVEVPTPWRGAYSVAFSPDNSAIAIGGYKKFGIFSAQTGKLLSMEQHVRSGLFKDNELTHQINSIEFSPDGKFLLTGSNEGTVKLWQIGE